MGAWDYLNRWRGLCLTLSGRCTLLSGIVGLTGFMMDRSSGRGGTNSQALIQRGTCTDWQGGARCHHQLPQEKGVDVSSKKSYPPFQAEHCAGAKAWLFDTSGTSIAVLTDSSKSGSISNRPSVTSATSDDSDETSTSLVQFNDTFWAEGVSKDLELDSYVFKNY